MDIAYLDPPYNQHPYGSNYHVLNTVAVWDKPAGPALLAAARTSGHPHGLADGAPLGLQPRGHGSGRVRGAAAHH